MPRKRVLDTPAARKKFIKMLTEGKSFRSIAQHFKVSSSTVSRYLKEVIADLVAKQTVERDLNTVESLLHELNNILDKGNKLLDACDEYLQDPDNPERYELGPRAHELNVVYYTLEGEEGKEKRIRHTDTLQNLLSRIEEEYPLIEEVKYKNADPRSLLIQMSNSIARQIEVAGKVTGKVNDVKVEINITNYIQTLIQDIQTVIAKETKGHPKIREGIISGIGRIAGPGNS